MSLVHQKLIVDPSPFGHRAHADFYSYRPGFSNEFPILIFVGGAINEETYHARETTRPDNLAAHFEAGCEKNGVTSAGFLAIPCPYGDPARTGTRLADMSKLIIKGFLKELGVKPDQVRALIGNSMGAYFLTGVSTQFTNARTLVTIAGAGMLDAVRASSRDWSMVETYCFSNADDPLRDHSERFALWMVSQGMHVEHSTRAGTHAFADYEAHGAVSDAFAKGTKALVIRTA